MVNHSADVCAYIEDRWVSDGCGNKISLVNPATEVVYAELACANEHRVNEACEAAQRAFADYRHTTVKERLHWLKALSQRYEDNRGPLAAMVTQEIGAPQRLAQRGQVTAGARQLRRTIKTLERFDWSAPVAGKQARLHYEPIGVCALITPWNWPLGQILAKVGPALACGCTLVLKPSEITTHSAAWLARLINEAGFPRGVFNLVQGTGAETGAWLSAHPIPRLVSFTGSTSTGRRIISASATSIKRLTLELGGKSPYVVFADAAQLERTIRRGVRACFHHSGQSCNAPTRMLVERAVYERALEIAARTASDMIIGCPLQPDTTLGPVASRQQFERVQSAIVQAREQGARVVAGGAGRPEHLARGFYVRPTVLVDVDIDSAAAQDEIFGPVLCILPFDDEAQAIELANRSRYGLAAWVNTADRHRAERVAHALDVGMVHINGTSQSSATPFGGVKQSGYGKEGGLHGMLEYLTLKAINGPAMGHKHR